MNSDELKTTYKPIAFHCSVVLQWQKNVWRRVRLDHSQALTINFHCSFK